MKKFLGILFFPIIAFGQPKPPGYEKLFTYGKSNSYQYGCIITTPLGYSSSKNNVPLFIFLHGNSRKGDDLNLVMNQYGSVFEQKRGFKIPGIVLAPQCYDGSWDYTLIDSLLEWTKKNYRIDTSRIYLLGMSMGGSGTWICGSRLNHKIAAMAPMCGGSYIQYGWTNPCALKKMPIWTFHGEKDEPVPVEETYTTIDEIKKCGGGDSLKVTYYPEKGHDLTFLFRDLQLYQWLLKHQKSDFTNYWMDEKEEIEEKIVETNRIQTPTETTKENSNQIITPKVEQKLNVISSKWSSRQINQAYPKNCSGFEEEEINVIKIINLARLFPRQFLEFEILDQPSKFNMNSSYVSSLKHTLNTMVPVEKLKGSQEMKRLANCFVIEQGPKGVIGHDRFTCPDVFFGECCSYGLSNSLEIVLQLLVDEGISSLGHRKICLDSKYHSIGVSIGSHKTYGSMAVLDFDLKKEFKVSPSKNESISSQIQNNNKPNNNTNNSNFKSGVQPTPTSNSKENKSKFDSKNSTSKQKSNRDKSKMEIENKTTCAPYFSTSTITSTDINELISNSVYHAGLEFEVPFHESKRYYFGIFTKTGFFIFPPTNNLPSKMNLNGITNQNNVSLIPNQEIGMVLFKHLKLGMGSFFDYRNSQLFYSNYFSASIGLKFDEYEIEFGSRYQNVMQQYQFFPSATLKIKPQR